jgi:DNA invertase Pin-like site-specific DNA recombinase
MLALIDCLDTTTPAGKAMFQMMGVFAEFERAMIQERVRAGFARAKAQGTKSGKPAGPENRQRDREGHPPGAPKERDRRTQDRG